jgi:trans-aconitate 2-methyltransferase
MTTTNHYTFGDNQRAARRLELLARVYEPVSRALLERFAPNALELALDLGAGPGHTTQLVHVATRAARTIGLEASERYLEQARATAMPGVEFMCEDVTAPSGRIPPAKLVFCRFLLTHLADPRAAIEGFLAFVRPGGAVLLQETASLESSHPALTRYYELVGKLQAHYGQRLYIGQQLEQLASGGSFGVEHAVQQRFTRPAAVMAELHLENLRTWRSDSFAQHTFESAQLDELERQLQAIVGGEEPAEPVTLGVGELVLRRVGGT